MGWKQRYKYTYKLERQKLAVKTRERVMKSIGMGGSGMFGGTSGGGKMGNSGSKGGVGGNNINPGAGSNLGNPQSMRLIMLFLFIFFGLTFVLVLLMCYRGCFKKMKTLKKLFLFYLLKIK